MCNKLLEGDWYVRAYARMFLWCMIEWVSVIITSGLHRGTPGMVLQCDGAAWPVLAVLLCHFNSVCRCLRIM